VFAVISAERGVGSDATVMQTPCIFCINEVRYIIDFSLSVASPRKPMATLPSMGESAAG
jgi:hypothetical protein